MKYIVKQTQDSKTFERVPFSELKQGDVFFHRGEPVTCAEDAHLCGDSDYDGYIVFGPDEKGYFEEDADTWVDGYRPGFHFNNNLVTMVPTDCLVENIQTLKRALGDMDGESICAIIMCLEDLLESHTFVPKDMPVYPGSSMLVAGGCRPGVLVPNCAGDFPCKAGHPLSSIIMGGVRQCEESCPNSGSCFDIGADEPHHGLIQPLGVDELQPWDEQLVQAMEKQFGPCEDLDSPMFPFRLEIVKTGESLGGHPDGSVRWSRFVGFDRYVVCMTEYKSGLRYLQVFNRIPGVTPGQGPDTVVEMTVETDRETCQPSGIRLLPHFRGGSLSGLAPESIPEIIFEMNVAAQAAKEIQRIFVDGWESLAAGLDKIAPK